MCFAPNGYGVPTHLTAHQIAGEPLQQEVVQYGPFVMTSRQEIQQTLLDCESHRFARTIPHPD